MDRGGRHIVHASDRYLDQAAERVGEAHLGRGVGHDVEQGRAADHEFEGQRAREVATLSRLRE